MMRSSEPWPYVESSPPVSDERLEFDAHVSFRRKKSSKRQQRFTNLLYAAFARECIKTSREHGEDEEEGGDQEVGKVVAAVERSEVFVPIFSRSFAESSRCLMEVEKMVECKRRILPIFFDVDPSDVRRQRGPFEQPFADHEKRFSKEKVKAWRDALGETGEISGHDLRNAPQGYEEKVIQLIVKIILIKVNKTPIDVAKHPLGINPRVDDLMKLVNIWANDVRVVAIQGMGGIGKTTLARALYNRIFSKFEGSSFVSNIKEVSRQPNGLVSLQNQLLHEALKGKVQPVSNSSQGTSVIKQRIHSKRVLVVLDDVDHIEQLNALVRPTWLSAGSRIILTTRYEHVLNVYGLKEHEIYRPSELNREESIQLFSFHAFGKDQPIEGFVGLTEKVVSATGGVPLALEVVGSSLFGKRSGQEWNDTLEKLKKVPPLDVQQTLRISYDGLDNLEKSIFLDTACFLSGTDRDTAIQMWKGCGFFPTIAIKVLMHKSLLKISEDDKLEMHDLLRDMGRQIVQEECPPNPGKRSRLWFQKDALHVLKGLKGTRNIEGIAVNFMEASDQDDHHLTTKSFAGLSNLRLLCANYANIMGKYSHLPKKLKWLQWHGCPLGSFPYDFNLIDLEVLDLSRSNINELQSKKPATNVRSLIGYYIECSILSAYRLLTGKHNHGMHTFETLKVLNLSGCNHFVTSPDLSNLLSLIKLTFDDSLNLMEVHDSIGNLRSLVYFSIRGCKSLEALPNSFVQLNSLKVLILSGCSKLSTLPEQLGCMQSLIEVALDETAIRMIPDSIGHLTRLSRLSLAYCDSLVSLPDSTGELCSLTELMLDNSAVHGIPGSVGSLKKLKRLGASNCSNLASIPDSFGSVENLEMLRITGSGKFNILPLSFAQLRNLFYLNLSYLGISELPENFGSLNKLKLLYLNGNNKLVMLPSTFCQLTSLERIDLKECSLSDGGISLDFSMFLSLKILNLDGNKFSCLPTTLSSLPQLEELSLLTCAKLQSLPPLPSSITKLDAYRCSSLERIPNISNLKSLRVLDFTDCKSLEDVPGLETLTSLMCLQLVGCTNLSSNFKKRIVKETFERLESLSIPGTKCPSWFKHQQLCCEVQKPSVGKHEIKGLLLWVVFSMIKRPFRCTFHLYSNFSLVVNGEDGSSTNFEVEVPVSYYRDSNMLFYHYRDGHPLIRLLKEGGSINILITEQFSLNDFQIVKGGIHPIYRPTEGQKDIASEEEALVPEKLAQFFMSP
ncbi:disease resistance protein RPV1-like isoform X2 [Nymphaea colorata]|nr:disease resistance protein RPV1-like isoform X2 [Nymphaea colorata]XP_031489229.1 disease resistance protein RPV1-like isoform X2 [Nymphaea colorata]XP_031489230.1 disease resistance protein RPV1-like isoform X2 [Nymphaea colorata]XP_049934105.1 disease resistance protein RPV1-like isoform X2 [Nymphaea colorata]